MPRLLTVSESATVLDALGCSLSERQIRYLGLQPSQRWSGKNGGVLFDAIDVTLLAVFAKLAAKCREWGLPVWSARAAVTYREWQLRRAIQRRTQRYLIVDRTRGVTTLSETPNDQGYALDIGALAQRVAAAVEEYRRDNPDVWVGSEEVEASELVTA